MRLAALSVVSLLLLGACDEAGEGSLKDQVTAANDDAAAAHARIELLEQKISDLEDRVDALEADKD